MKRDDWEPEVDAIRARRRLAQQHGGRDAVEKQHAEGRLAIRERIGALLDAGSFRERGPIAGHSECDEDGSLRSFTPANYVLGTGRIDGRLCVVGGEDFTQRGGSPSAAGLRKSVYAEDLCLRLRVPLVRFLQGGGGSVAGTAGKRPEGARSEAQPSEDRTGKGAKRGGGGGGGEGAATARHRFTSIADAMATVPVASAALGAVAGLPAARLVASHFAVMARDTAQVMIAGPALVERALGERRSKQELGGAAVHARSGVVDAVARDEADAFDQVRRFLSYLPSHVWQPAPRSAATDERERAAPELLAIVPRDRRKIYDARRLVGFAVDRNSFFELGRGYGRSQITALARLDGQPVGVWANDPRFYAGAMTADAARKVRRFVELCDTFHLPVVAFVDEPGFMIGSRAEQAATIRFGTEAIFAVVQATVPWASVIVRKSYGVAAAAHFAPDAVVFAWPSAEGGALPIEGGVAVAFRREIASAPDPDARRRELEEQFASARSPFPRAEAFAVHDLIDPRETRARLCDWVEEIQPALASQLGPRGYALRP
jgi:acetyl-CoA carboxylase carboxyltransferase component